MEHKFLVRYKNINRQLRHLRQLLSKDLINTHSDHLSKGFTLIEVLITISISAIFMTLALFSASNYSRVKNQLDIVISENAVLDILNNSKQYCREKEKSGYVLFDIERNEIDFFSENKRIDSFLLPKGVSINFINTQNSRIDVNKYGATSDAGTIVLRDNNGALYSIVINVGTGYAEIQ